VQTWVLRERTSDSRIDSGGVRRGRHRVAPQASVENRSPRLGSKVLGEASNTRDAAPETLEAAKEEKVALVGP
jgi:hypothetical protein